MAPQGPACDIDWVASNTSNVHVATHRDWFDTYTEFPTKISPFPGGQATLPALGIGTVVLETRVYDQDKKSKPSRTITLHNVLYMPDYLCNVFAFETEEEFAKIPMQSWPFRPASPASPITMKDSGRLVGLIVNPRLMKLWLKGQSKQQTSLGDDSEYYIHASWPAEERARWEEYRKRMPPPPAPANDTKLAVDSVPPLTDAEKKYLKEGWGNEFKFLLAYGYKIHDDDSRAEGRQLLRSLMNDDAQPKR